MLNGLSLNDVTSTFSWNLIFYSLLVSTDFQQKLYHHLSIFAEWNWLVFQQDFALKILLKYMFCVADFSHSLKKDSRIKKRF